jgi:DNA mismatch endonuclease, patch repair protein
MAKSKIQHRDKPYVRDARSPIPKSESVSRVMSANKAKETKPEQQLRKALRELGLRGYRKNWKSVPGRPDIAFVGKKVAVFVHGCYWHRCPKCDYPLPKTNTAFWEKKFQRNIKRDRSKRQLLEAQGWRVLEFWECDIHNDSAAIAIELNNQLRSQS